MDGETGPVGLIGLGLMGRAIWTRLNGSGHAVLGYDVAAAAMERLAGEGGAIAASIAEIARRCPIAVVAVLDTAQVEDVLEGPAGLLAAASGDRATRIVINTATCDPDRIAALAARAAPEGLDLVELPISGTSAQVARGDGVGLLAGSPAALDSARAVIDAIAPRTYRMGAIGNGGRTKLAINHILGLNRAALAEGLVLADRLGLPLDAFLEAARGSAAYSQIMDIKGDKMIAGDFAPHGKVTQSLKDFRLILAAAASRDQELPLARVYAELLAGNIAAGEGDLDNAAIIAQIRRLRAAASGT